MFGSTRSKLAIAAAMSAAIVGGAAAITAGSTADRTGPPKIMDFRLSIGSSGAVIAGTAAWNVNVPNGGPSNSCLYVSGPGFGESEALGCDDGTGASRHVDFDLVKQYDYVLDGGYTFTAQTSDRLEQIASAQRLFTLNRVPSDGIGPIDTDPEAGVNARQPIAVKFGAGSGVVGRSATVKMRRADTDAVLATKSIALAARNSVTFTAPNTEHDINFTVTID